MTTRTVSFPTAAYLHRIGDLDANGAPDAQLVAAVAAAQHRTVPFENLDIHRGRPVSVVPRDLADTLIVGRRGGICYQLNGLLGLALRALGVPVAFWGARVSTAAGTGPERGHMAVVARPAPGELLLVDVGFGGDRVLRPIDPADPASLRVRVGEASYALDPVDRELPDFAEMARWHSTSPESRFTGSVICTLPAAAGGRTTLAARPGPGGALTYRLIDDTPGGSGPAGRAETALTVDEATAVLRARFGMPATRAPRRSALVRAALDAPALGATAPDTAGPDTAPPHTVTGRGASAPSYRHGVGNGRPR